MLELLSPLSVFSASVDIVALAVALAVAAAVVVVAEALSSIPMAPLSPAASVVADGVIEVVAASGCGINGSGGGVDAQAKSMSLRQEINALKPSSEGPLESMINK